MGAKPIVFSDYQILDHLLKVERDTYKGKAFQALLSFKERCAGGHVELWVADITWVEMIHGRENPRLSVEKLAKIQASDQRKLEIASEMKAKKLGYPCSKLGDKYSRLGVSFRLCGPNSSVAQELEERLLQIEGVSDGDARQLVSVVYGPDDSDVSRRPAIEWVVTEDRKLREGVADAVNEGKLLEFSGIRLVSVLEFDAAQQPAAPDEPAAPR